ncbi:hypothetical protein [Methylobacterium sp. WL6]|uniref:hypothetical protein n=1 Tax=Methylobacterium sp. WL6 TaxID=2603901 RepID=UPI0011CBFC41|nr:hypothetical protein [Methylobacterium sp. WL6]TXN73440.1 hypothetical protein FV230_01330 [Methylobacterium sp. WL6]
MHSKLLSAIAREAENNPQLAAILQEMRRQGGVPTVIMHDVNTGAVTSSENGGPFMPTHAAIRSIVMGVPYRDPGLVDPATAEDDEVGSMLRYFTDYYRGDLLNHPYFDEAIKATIRGIHRPSVRQMLSDLEDNYQRWNRVVEAFLEAFDEE